jgi:hypothetical protein
MEIRHAPDWRALPKSWMLLRPTVICGDHRVFRH